MLNYITRGQGPRPVLLLHGFLGSSRNVQSLARAWVTDNPQLRVFIPDLPGHGRSPALRTNSDLCMMAEDIIPFVEQFELKEPLTIVGHSLGGRAALKMRQLNSNLIQNIILLDIGPSPLDNVDSRRTLQLFLEAPNHAFDRDEMRKHFEDQKLSRALADWLLMNGDQMQDGFRWRVDRKELELFHKKMRSDDLWDSIDTYENHTVVIRGERSTYVDEKDMSRFESIGVPVHTIQNAGHFLHIEKPKAVAELTLQILGR